MPAARKAYKGIAMEGAIATWYSKNTGKDPRRFLEVARTLGERIVPPARVLEVAPGPGYLAVELAKRGFRVVALDISKSFVRMTGENARKAGVEIDVRLGDAAAMPFEDGQFDYVICMAAFKNFTHPLGAIDEMHRVLAPGGRASIFDLRKDAAPADIRAEVHNMQLSAFNALLTRWTFKHMLLKSAYTIEAIDRMAKQSRFGGGIVSQDGIGFELLLVK
jgi:ubiquinone/menaquinone biosynthesis C-methylase UbiE